MLFDRLHMNVVYENMIYVCIKSISAGDNIN